jgi:hypothetical protein
LFTYQIWAPGIIVPIVVGAMSRERSAVLNRAVLAAMTIGPLSTLVYARTPAADAVDPAVAGVGVSVLVYVTVRAVEVLRRRTR